MTAIKMLNLLRKTLLILAGGAVVGTVVINGTKAVKKVKTKKTERKIEADADPKVKPMTKTEVVKETAKEFGDLMKKDANELSRTVLSILEDNAFLTLGGILGIAAMKDEMDSRMKKFENKWKFSSAVSNTDKKILSYIADVTDGGKGIPYGRALTAVKKGVDNVEAWESTWFYDKDKKNTINVVNYNWLGSLNPLK